MVAAEDKQRGTGQEPDLPVPMLYHLAIDDGRKDRTTVWALPARLVGQCETGATGPVATRTTTRRTGSPRR